MTKQTVKNKIMSTFFFEFSQNNSGGSFIVDSKLCNNLFIEAENYKQANKKAKELGVYFNGCNMGRDCDCCGDRWYMVSETSAINLESAAKSFSEEFKTIKDYAQYLANRFGCTKPDARIFYIDGTIEEIFTNK